MVFMTPVTNGRNRRMTVNERINGILEGTIRDTFHDEEQRKVRMANMDEYRRKSKLYNFSIDHKFLKSSVGNNKKASGLNHPKRCQSVEILSPLAEETPKTGSSMSKIKTISKETENKPVWYVGYRNKASGFTKSPLARMARYGAYGSLQLSALETHSGSYHCSRKDGTQDANIFDNPLNHPLKSNVNEWTPPLSGPPSLWPGEAAYVAGVDICFQTTRASSVALNKNVIAKKKMQAPSYGDKIQRADNRDLEEFRIVEKQLIEDKKKKNEQMVISLNKIAENKIKFDEYVKNTQSNHVARKVDSRTLNHFTMIVTKESSETSMKTREEKQLNMLLSRKHELKWKYLGVFIYSMKLDVNNKLPLSQELQKLQQLMAEAADTGMGSAHHWLICRDNFVSLLLKKYSSLTQQELNRLYSSFDPYRTDEIDFREFLATIRVIRAPENNVRHVLLDVFRLFTHNPDDTMESMKISKDYLLKLFLLLCGSADEEKEMQDYFKNNIESCTKLQGNMREVSYPVFQSILSSCSDLIHKFRTLIEDRRRDCSNVSR